MGQGQSMSNLPFFHRFPNYQVQHTEMSEDQLEFPVSTVEYIGLKGKKAFAQYLFDQSATNLRHPKGTDLITQYQGIIRKMNGKQLLSSENAATFQVKINDKMYWTAIETFEGGSKYCILVVEGASGEVATSARNATAGGNSAPSMQLRKFISAKDLYDEINAHGKATLNISFETGKFDLPQESHASVEEIAKLMKKATNLKISIEGHTDDVGTRESNKALSEKRARALLDALVQLGIPASRMSSKGWGSEEPLVPNNSEQNRLLNRRVEIIRVR